MAAQLPFKDRSEAGRRLAERLQQYKGRDVLVLAVPRGGVVVGYEVARALGAELDVILTRKIGAPGNPEYAIGVVTETGDVLLNQSEIEALGVPEEYLREEIERQRKEIQRRQQLYRQGRPLPRLRGRTVIVVDDGIATGFTIRGALRAIRSKDPQELVLAVPVAPREVVESLRAEVDNLVCLATPEPFFAIGLWYEEFPQISDEEVLNYLQRLRPSVLQRRRPTRPES